MWKTAVLRKLQLAFYYLRQRRRYMFLPVFVCLSVCWQDYSKICAWIWMKCCASTDVGTWTNWLTFEPNPDYSLDAGTGLLSPISYKHWYVEFYVGKIPRIRIGTAHHCSNMWFQNGFIHSAVETPLSEVHALHRVPFYFGNWRPL